MDHENEKKKNLIAYEWEEGKKKKGEWVKKRKEERRMKIGEAGKGGMGKRYFGMCSLLVGAKSNFTGPIVTPILILWRKIR